MTNPASVNCWQSVDVTAQTRWHNHVSRRWGIHHTGPMCWYIQISQTYSYSVSQKVTPLNVWLWQVQTCTTLHIIKRAQVLMYFDYGTVTKFCTNPSYHLADFLFLQNVVKKCSYQQHYTCLFPVCSDRLLRKRSTFFLQCYLLVFHLLDIPSWFLLTQLWR